MTKTLLSAVALAYLGGAVVAGAAINDDSIIIDMAGYEGVLLITTIEDSVSGAVAAMTVEQNSANSGAGMAALADAIATLTSSGNDDLNGKQLVVDIYQPTERYLRVNRASSVANIAYGSLIAIRYGARKLPETDDGTIGHLVAVSSPAEA